MYTQYTIFIMNMKITPDYSKSAAMRFFSWGLKNEFETAVVKEPSVFDPLKFYCTLKRSNLFLFFFLPTLKEKDLLHYKQFLSPF